MCYSVVGLVMDWKYKEVFLECYRYLMGRIQKCQIPCKEEPCTAKNFPTHIAKSSPLRNTGIGEIFYGFSTLLQDRTILLLQRQVMQDFVLAGVAQLVGVSSCNQKFAGLILSQCTYLSCGFVHMGSNRSLTSMFLSLCLLSLPLQKH